MGLGNGLFMPLTYKSIHLILQEAVESGQLLLWEPTVPGDPCLRTLYISAEINDEFEPKTWADPAVAIRYASLDADFERFVHGDLIPIGMAPFDKGDDAFMARVDPVEYGIWTIRSVSPSPAIRVFGAFCMPDTFVALLTRRRKNLGGRGSREWKEARESALERWRAIFGSQRMVLGDNLDDYITEAAIIV